MSFQTKIFLSTILFGLSSCGENSLKNIDAANSSDASAIAQYAVKVDQGFFGLVDAELSGVAGGFTKCDQGWSIMGAKGTVSAPASCAELIYKSADLVLAGVTKSLTLNGAVTDENGVTWTFSKEPDGSYAVNGSFSVNSGNLSTEVKRDSRYDVSVTIDEGDGAVCLATEAFTLNSNGLIVTLGVNAPKEGWPEGTELSLTNAAPEISIDQVAKQFIIDTQNKADGKYTYGPFVVSKGKSSCTLNSLTITVVGDKPVRSNELHIVGVYGRASVTNQVKVDTGTDVTLVLTSYESIKWNVTTSPDTKIVKIIISGYGTQSVTGVSSDLITDLTKKAENFGYAYKFPATTFIQKAETYTGMKAASHQFGYEPREFLVTNAQSQAIPVDAEVHLIGAYEGTNPSIHISETQRPVVLVITSYETIKWKISLAPGANVARIIYYSHQDCYGLTSQGYSSFTGVSPRIIQRLSYDQLSYFYDVKEAGPVTTKVEAMLGRKVTETYGAYGAKSFDIK